MEASRRGRMMEMLRKIINPTGGRVIVEVVLDEESTLLKVCLEGRFD